jgi:predicted Zn-dependent peptidase
VHRAGTGDRGFRATTGRTGGFGASVRSECDESDRNTGISHFIEHLLFKGSARYSAEQIAEIFDGLGDSPISTFHERASRE